MQAGGQAVGAPPAKPAAATDGTNAATGAKTNLAAEFVPIFDDTAAPGYKGVDPFFPTAGYWKPAPPPPQIQASSTAPADPQLKLLSVAGSPKRWLATINNHIFDAKETASVEVPGGRVRLQVIEIGSNYADVVIEGTGVAKRITLSQEK